MSKLTVVVLAIAIIPGACLAGVGAPIVNANLATAQDLKIDLGCLRGDLRATKFPTTTYDEASHERIMYNISRCTGGFILGVNPDTGKSWHADIAPNRSMTGKDLDGNAWRYDPKARRYTNLATGASCADANLRHVCTP